MYVSLASLLILVFSIGGASAADEFPDVTNETSIDTPSEVGEEDEGLGDMTIIIAATIFGLCIVGAAIILKK